MAWRLSTGMVKALLGGTPSVANSANATTITMGDGDGVGAGAAQAAKISEVTSTKVSKTVKILVFNSIISL